MVLCFSDLIWYVGSGIFDGLPLVSQHPIPKFFLVPTRPEEGGHVVYQTEIVLIQGDGVVDSISGESE